jgi:hypothetical protein
MSMRIEGGSAAINMGSIEDVGEVQAPPPPPPPPPEVEVPTFSDGFEASTNKPPRNLLNPPTEQLQSDAPTMSLSALMSTGGLSRPTGRQIEGLVKDAYAEVLMREPDAGGAQTYKEKALELARIGATADDIQEFLRSDLARSPEGQVIAAVNQQFEKELGRTPEAKGYWHEQALEWRKQGASLGQIHQRLSEALHTSPERALKHPEEFLNREYQQLLGRDVDGDGLAHYSAKMKELNAAGAPFKDIQKSIEQEIMASPEYRTRQASATSGVGGLSPSDKDLAARVDKALEGTGLAGKGGTIVAAARKERVPIDLMMSMLQKESSFLSKENNLSIANNNPGNLRWASDGWEAQFGGKPGGPGNFTTFPSVEKGIEAMAHLLGDVYRKEIDTHDYKALVYKYCPPSDQPGGQADTDRYVQQMNDWTQAWQKKLGVDSNWINSSPAGSTAPTKPGSGSPSSLRGITPSQINDAKGFDDQWTLCGPIAAVAASRYAGKPVSLAEARKLASDNNHYTPGGGMHGPDSEVALLKDLGIASHTEAPVNWEKVKQQVQSGKPVIISTPQHYFVIEDYNANTGKFECGNSALAMNESRGQQTEMSPAEFATWGRGAATAVMLD